MDFLYLFLSSYNGYFFFYNIYVKLNFASQRKSPICELQFDWFSFVDFLKLSQLSSSYISQRALQKEKEKREDAELAKKNLLHECRVLRGRLEDCNVNVFLEEEDSLTVNPSALPDALDLLATSDNRIGLLLAEVCLFDCHDMD